MGDYKGPCKSCLCGSCKKDIKSDPYCCLDHDDQPCPIISCPDYEPKTPEGLEK